MLAAASASSSGGIWGVGRSSTAISSGLTPAPVRAATRGGGQQPVGQGQDLGAGAVVVLQPDHPGFREPAGEAGQVLGGGPGEGVDRLVLVADHGQVAPL